MTRGPRKRNTRQGAETSAVTVPIGTDVEFVEASCSGSDIYQQFLDHWKKQIFAMTGERKAK